MTTPRPIILRELPADKTTDPAELALAEPYRHYAEWETPDPPDPSARMTPILKHLHQHFPADWKQAEPNPDPNALSLWFQDAEACALLQIGESVLFVRWPKGIGHGGQYSCGGWWRTCSRKELNASIPSIVAGAALNEAKHGRPVPAVPEWAKQELLVQGAERLADFKQKAVSARALADRLEAECIHYSAALTP